MGLALALKQATSLPYLSVTTTTKNTTAHPIIFHKKYGSHELLLEKTTALRTAEKWWLK